MGAREFLGQSIDVVKVAVRLVLVLLLQLSVIEAIVVEMLIARGLGTGTADCGIGGVGGTDRARNGRVD